MERTLVIDSGKCQACFPKWSEPFPFEEIGHSLNDRVSRSAYMARMAIALITTTTTTTPAFRGRMVAV